VLSSTSSSNQRLPGGPWLRVWLVALVVAVLSLAALEGFWRVAGHVPSVNDDADLWMVIRHSLVPDDPNQVVLVGASRIQQGINTEVFARHFGGRKPAQLAVGGTTMVPVLDHLSRDESFRGMVIADVIPFLFYPGGFATDRGAAAQYVARYEKVIGNGKTFSATLVERNLRTLVQERLVLRLPALAPTLRNVQSWVEERALPPPSGRVALADRSQLSDYRSLDQATLDKTKQLWVDRIRQFGYGPPADELERGLQSLEAMVTRIQDRGGRVVFVAFPASGIVHEMEEERQPRAKYWDVLAAHTRALTIHFTDYPELASTECLEGSHLDYRDAARFTDAFARILQQDLRRAHARRDVVGEDDQH
jgi:hypothetical protein